MKSRTVVPVVASAVLAASLVAGCQAPGASKQAVSFHGVSYTEGQVARTAEQLNELLPVQTIQQTFGVSRLTRIHALNLLIYTPAVKEALGNSTELDAQVKTLVGALKAQTGTKIQPEAATSEALRNFIAVTSDADGTIAQTFRKELAAEPPQISERYGHPDPVTGQGLLPNVPDVVSFGSPQQPQS